jgi:hypothetical protein
MGCGLESIGSEVKKQLSGTGVVIFIEIRTMPEGESMAH